MIRTLLSLTLLGGLLAPAPAAADAPGVKPAAHHFPRVAVLRQAGLASYEQVAEEFRSRVRAAVRVISASQGQRAALLGWIRSYHPDLVLTIGQSAHDLLRGSRIGPTVAALVYHRLSQDEAVVPVEISPAAVVEAFRLARPATRRLGVLHGPETGALALAAARAMAPLGVVLRVEAARTPGDAISRLRQMRDLDGLWLMTDLEILTPQVFQYALVLQFRRGIPVLGATRRHAAQGALFALDHDPHEVGRQAAALTNQLLAGTRPAPLAQLPAELTVNLATAQRLRIASTALRRRAVLVFQ